MRKDDDYAGVDPARIGEVKRRIAVLRQYLEIDRPLGSDAEAAAREIGVGIGSFYTLLRTWKRTKRPADLPGAQIPGARRTGQAHLDPAAERVLVKAISANRGKPIRETTRAIRAAFRAANIEAPSAVTIARRAQQAMGESGYWPDLPPGAVIVLLAFQIGAAVAGEGGEVLPWIVMARHAADRRLLAWNLSLDFPDDDACREALMSGLHSLTIEERSRIGTKGPPTIITAPPIRIDLSDAGRVITYSGWSLAVAGDASVELARGLFGRRLAELPLRPWRPGSPAKPRAQTPRLGIDELRERLELALGSSKPPASTPPFDLALYLADRLAALVVRP